MRAADLEMAEVRADVRAQNLRCCTAAGRLTLDLSQLHIRSGERVAVIGPNGAGKSTLLRCLSGFARPSSGQLEVLGRDMTVDMRGAGLRALRCEIGQVHQGQHLVQRLSALDNVMIGALGRQPGRLPGWRSWLRLHPAAARAQAHQALAAVGLLAHAPTRADQLSGGEQQKLSIARMLMQRPRLILADEPTASLDPTAAREVCRLLRHSAAGATLLVVVHNPDLLPLLADRVIGLQHGRLQFDLRVEQLDAARLEALYHAPNALTEHARAQVPPARARTAL